MNRFDIPDVGYTEQDVEKKIAEYRNYRPEQIEDEDIKKLEYRVTPIIDRDHFIGYEYQIDGKKYHMHFTQPIIKSKKLAICGYETDDFIKKQMPEVYRGIKSEIAERAYYFGVPNPIYILPQGEPGVYEHYESDEPLQDRIIKCQYQRGSDGLVYRHGQSVIVGANRIYLEYSWGILKNITIISNNVIIFAANFDHLGCVVNTFFNHTLPGNENIKYFYSFQQGILNGPAWCYNNQDNYLLTMMKNGNYQQFKYYGSNPRSGIFDVTAQSPISVLWEINRLTDNNFPQFKHHAAKIGIFNNAYQLIYYSDYNSTIIENPFVVYDKNLLNNILWYDFDGNEASREESFMILTRRVNGLSEVIPFGEGVKIVGEYIYGDQYAKYLTMLLREFGAQMKPEDREAITKILKWITSPTMK